APAFLLAGDETAIPAIRQLLGALPEHTPAKVHVEVADPDGRLKLPAGNNVTLVWSDLPPGAPSGETLVAAVAAARLGAGTRIWATGEAAAMQRIRRQLFDDQALPRSQATVRGYWKHGRAEDTSSDP
ncbi:MAG: siderophore-interacting protein, partial [Acidimicrobiales bacterium]